MAGRNNSTGCYRSTLNSTACYNPSEVCHKLSWDKLNKSIGQQLGRVNALQVASAIVAGVIIVGFKSYRHRPSSRFIFLAATTLFLPIYSSVVSSIAGNSSYINARPEQIGLSMAAYCGPQSYTVRVVVWAFLVQVVMFNTSVVVAIDDREGVNKGPPFQILVQGLWALYLGVSNFLYSTKFFSIAGLEGIPFALICAKIGLKYYAFEKARQSFAFGRNPCLIFGYMQQTPLQEASQHGGPTVGEVTLTPPLLVMGEETRQVEKHPTNGYMFKDGTGTTLVTLHRVWQLPLSARQQQLKDLCLSFAFFKLLRCRFARYELTNARSKGMIFNFFWSMLLEDGGHDRVFRVIGDEIGFVHDCYYSSLAVSYSRFWLPIMVIFISLSTIGYCIMLAEMSTAAIVMGFKRNITQFACTVWCISQDDMVHIFVGHKEFGSAWLDFASILLLLVLVIVAEAREMACYICSNWTKVTLMCHLVNRASSRHCLRMPKWVVGILLKSRCKLLKHWDEKIGQCSLLAVHPRATLFVPHRHLLRLPDKKTKVKVTSAVKACIIEALRRSNNDNRRQLSNGAASLRRSQVGESFLWACNGKGTSGTILTWHIATSILEVRHPFQQSLISDHNKMIKMVAIHLSRYCAYLVSWCPELLPDNEEWSKGLYKDVKKEAERVLAGGRAMAGQSSAPEAKYQQLIDKLQHFMDKLRPSADNSTQQEVVTDGVQVLKNGAELGKQLVQLAAQDEESTDGGVDAAWKLLAEFWSEMVLFVAPSDNLKGHSEAIARGGELITLLWVLLFHAGIVSRPAAKDDDGASASAASTSASPPSDHDGIALP